MDKNIKKSYGIAKWFYASVISFVMLFLAIAFINNADFFADNINFLLDDPYIYWVVGWCLFIISILIFSYSCVKYVLGLFHYLNSEEFKKIKAEYDSAE